MKQFNLYDVHENVLSTGRQGYPFKGKIIVKGSSINGLIEQILALQAEYNEAAEAYNSLIDSKKSKKTEFSKSEIKKLKFATHPDRNNGDDTAYRLIQKIIGE